MEPLLSPSGDKAARIEIYDAGATGGGYSVAVYSHHGFGVKTVMSGAWESVDRGDLRWIDNNVLEIHYDGRSYEGRKPFCSDTPEVHVICIRRPTPLNDPGVT